MTSMQLSEVSFEEFVVMAEPRLRHALIAAVGWGRGREATAEALAYGWEHWGDLRVMAKPDDGCERSELGGSHHLSER